MNNAGKCTLFLNSITTSSSDFLVPAILTYPIAIGAGDSLSLPIRFQPTSLGPQPLRPSRWSATIRAVRKRSGFLETRRLVSWRSPARRSSAVFGLLLGRSVLLRSVTWRLSAQRFERRFQNIQNRHWKLINNPFPATLHPGSCLSVVIRYKATEKCPRSCDLIILSDDPLTPVKTLEVVAYTIWSSCGCQKVVRMTERDHARSDTMIGVVVKSAATTAITRSTKMRRATPEERVFNKRDSAPT